jgi:phage shock protein PspC (stress-responsive transcriptional regulator)
MIAGVAGGMGRYFGVDPVIIRIAIVVLTFFGGAGALLYIAAILLVPNEDEVPGGAGAAATGPPAERSRGLMILGIVLLVVVAGPLLFAPALFAGGIIVPLLILALVGLGVSWLVTGQRPARDAGSIVRAIFVGLGVLVLLAVLSVAAFWGAGVGGETFVAIIVIAAGVAILAAAFVRPVRWLILPALAVALPAAFVAAAGISLDGGYGERTYRPRAANEINRTYEIGAGQLTLDLRNVDLPPGDRRLKIGVGMGEAVILVPADLCVTTDANLGMGQADVFDRGTGGIDVDWVEQSAARSGAARLVVDADIGVGHLDIRKTAPGDRQVHRNGNRHGNRDGWNAQARGINDACAA